MAPVTGLAAVSNYSYSWLKVITEKRDPKENRPSSPYRLALGRIKDILSRSQSQLWFHNGCRHRPLPKKWPKSPIPKSLWNRVVCELQTSWDHHSTQLDEIWLMVLSAASFMPFLSNVYNVRKSFWNISNRKLQTKEDPPFVRALGVHMSRATFFRPGRASTRVTENGRKLNGDSGMV